MRQSRVLIVDDEASLRRALRITLGAAGFDVQEAATGEEALTLVGVAHYDAVLLDIDLPGMDGIQTCRELRRQNCHLPVLMLTVRDREEDRSAAFNAGADDYFTKPFSLSELLCRLRRCSGLEPEEL